MRMFAIALVATLGFQAAAADLTVGQCLNIGIALRALDCAGRDLETQRALDQRPSNAIPTACAKQYKLGDQRGPLAYLLASLQATQDVADKTRNTLIAKIGAGKQITPGSPEMAEFLEAWQKVLDGHCNVNAPLIPRDALNLGDGDDHNQIPLNVLSALMPIINNLPVADNKPK